MTVLRMDNVGIVVEDLAATVAFFVELGLELEGETSVQGQWVDETVGLDGVRSDIAMLKTPDGHSKVELARYRAPDAIQAPLNTPANTVGMHRLMFAVDDINDVISRLRPHGAELLGKVTQFEDMFLLCYLRGPEGIIVGLAEPLS